MISRYLQRELIPKSADRASTVRWPFFVVGKQRNVALCWLGGASAADEKSLAQIPAFRNRKLLLPREAPAFSESPSQPDAAPGGRISTPSSRDDLEWLMAAGRLVAASTETSAGVKGAPTGAPHPPGSRIRGSEDVEKSPRCGKRKRDLPRPARPPGIN